MPRPSVLRLNLLRGGYLLLVVGLGSAIWPSILDVTQGFALQRGVVVCMLAALSLLSVLGLRYPLGMLPLLFFEMAWKSIWLVRIALRPWLAHRIDAATAETAFECVTVVIFPLIVPWSYVWRTFLIAPADPWRRSAVGQVSGEPA